MEIDKLIDMLEELKSEGIVDVSLERASILENVANDFRSGYIWLDGIDKNNEYINAIEIDISE